MGRKASHVALECALQSHPNMVRNPAIPLCICPVDLHTKLSGFISTQLCSGYPRRGGFCVKTYNI